MRGGKVGGVGDVVRELPIALTHEGWQVTVLTPSYGMFHTLPDTQQLASIDVEFGGKTHSVEVFDVPGTASSVRNIVFEHDLFSPAGPGLIYSNDEPERPFATDATKFAFYCAAAATWIGQQATAPDVVHLHDWHAATYLLLRAYADGFDKLRGIHTVFTIHNLSYQGTRPREDDESSLETWFPGLPYDRNKIRDPHVAHCYNPMAAAIRLADKLSTVSPTYATEICRASDPDMAFVGGEGLEQELLGAYKGDRLVGILNGCEYARPAGRRPGWQRILDLASRQIAAWHKDEPSADVHRLARNRLMALPKRRPKIVLTSIGRLVRQKASLFLEPLSDGRSALQAILEDIGRQGVLILLGSGETEYEESIAEIAERADNFLFLRGYSETLAEPLYRNGDLFLMPSSFEPCGISQMLAMRFAQPCIVHGVGGLRDTVEDGRTGFVFNGETTTEQATNFVATVRRALDIKTNDNDRFQRICIRAASARFSWNESARQTIDHLYARS